MDNVIFEDHFTQYAISASREYQEIHPYSAVNIDSVKINTSLIMMKECPMNEEQEHANFSLRNTLYTNFESLLECICVEGILEVTQAQNAVN